MSVSVREHASPVLGSLLLHAAIAGALLWVARVSIPSPAQLLTGPSIDAVVIDADALSAAQAQLRERTEATRRLEEQALQAKQDAQKAKDEAAQRAAEHAREQAAQQAKEQAAQEAAQSAAKNRAAAAKAESQRHAQAAAQNKLNQARQLAVAAEQKQHDRAAKLAAEGRARAERESELRNQLQAEEKAAALGPLQNHYIASLQNRITRAWLKPESARAGIVCRIEVTQIPGGVVTKARVTDCNGDEAVRQSIENAVYRASPLPEPPDPALFQRIFTLVFKPND
jgi:colicin import membrane protein